jgi:hypothetical protein
VIRPQGDGRIEGDVEFNFLAADRAR